MAESSSWLADAPLVRYENYTSDGQTYEEGPREALYRQHFSLSNTMVMHNIETREAVGALFTNMTLYAIQLLLYFYLVAAFINKRLELGRYITKNRIIKLSGPQL